MFLVYVLSGDGTVRDSGGLVVATTWPCIFSPFQAFSGERCEVKRSAKK